MAPDALPVKMGWKWNRQWEKLKSGDYIEAFNGQKLGSKEELAEAVSHFQGENVTLTVRRNGEETEVRINPVKGTDGSCKLGYGCGMIPRGSEP